MTFQDPDASWSAIDENAYLRGLAKKILDDRLRRSQFLPIALLHEAAWDATLTLFLGEPGLSHCAESLANKLDLPLTTMTRWIAVLENEGLIEARLSSLHPERESVRLSVLGHGLMQDYLRTTASLFDGATVSRLCEAPPLRCEVESDPF